MGTKLTGMHTREGDPKAVNWWRELGQTWDFHWDLHGMYMDIYNGFIWIYVDVCRLMDIYGGYCG